MWLINASRIQKEERGVEKEPVKPRRTYFLTVWQVNPFIRPVATSHEPRGYLKWWELCSSKIRLLTFLLGLQGASVRIFKTRWASFSHFLHVVDISRRNFTSRCLSLFFSFVISGDICEAFLMAFSCLFFSLESSQQTSWHTYGRSNRVVSAVYNISVEL